MIGIDALNQKVGQTSLKVNEFNPRWDGPERCSTHELVIREEDIFVSGQKMGQIAHFNTQGDLVARYTMPRGSGPHGLLLDGQRRLWVSLEFSGIVARLGENGTLAEKVDVRMKLAGSSQGINPAPHGICIDADGETIWFTGKRTSTIGKINPDRSVEHFEINSLAAMPIFLYSSTPGTVWGTELLGNHILQVNAEGEVTELPIPTPNSRPIGIVRDPRDPSILWFTEEAGRKIGRIKEGAIQEFFVPYLQEGDVLGSLCFGLEGDLWVQIYFSGPGRPGTAQDDAIMRFDRAILDHEDADISSLVNGVFQVPSRDSMLHRIRCDKDGSIWFTEMMTDRLGRIGH